MISRVSLGRAIANSDHVIHKITFNPLPTLTMKSSSTKLVENFMRRQGSNNAPLVFDTAKKIDDLEVFISIASDFDMSTGFNIDEDLFGVMGVNWGGGRWVKIIVEQLHEPYNVVSEKVILIRDRLKDYFCETFSDWELDFNRSTAA